MPKGIEIISILAIGPAMAFVFSFLCLKLKLPVIIGQLLAGYLIGPFSPGYVADYKTTEQLADIGVILMLFGVGLHFKIAELIKVKKIAIPGAIIQIILIFSITFGILPLFGVPLLSSGVIGLSVAVASTVVVLKILLDYGLLDTKSGTITVGELIVEDVFTIFVLLMLPLFGSLFQENAVLDYGIIKNIIFSLAKCALFVLLMLTVVQIVISKVLTHVAQFKSQEMLTLAIVAIIFSATIGPAYLLGLPISLGAFLTGILIGNTSVRDEATADSLPLKNIFSVLFFLSIGMLFNPKVLVTHLSLFLILLFIIVIIKPLTTFGVSKLLGCNTKNALVIGLASGQIGEFSFILAEDATKMNILPDYFYDIIVACAIVSLLLNSLLFKRLKSVP